ncbi:MAG: toll/interleukin-1 receptor domain-containing protein [Hyphomonadaceae bacterium]|nr:toll/interleukin-1 receptor domain-containing protein [Hyphomonadaceae bacterium]
MVDVFISYKREDHVRVDKLASLLKEFQLSVWHDAALQAGDDWHARIMQVAEKASALSSAGPTKRRSRAGCRTKSEQASAVKCLCLRRGRRANGPTCSTSSTWPT